MRKNNIDEYEGQGIFVDRHTMRIKTNDTDTQISFGSVIIATGATPRLQPGTSRGPRVRTYEDQIMARKLPSSIAIIGAGPIGMEFAYVLANYGVDVTVIESLDRVLPNEDIDVSKEIAKAYRNLGVTVLVFARIEELTETADAIALSYRSPGAPSAQTLTVDTVLQAIGFAPNTPGYGL
jgi:dihydrolipoamide dehydrogenase